MISAVIRDIVIILVGITNIALFIMLAVLIWQIWQLVKMIQREIRPIIDDTQETVGTVRGTADFVSANVVAPVVRTGGKLAGFRRSVRVLQDEIRGSMSRRGEPGLAPPPGGPAPVQPPPPPPETNPGPPA